MSIRRSATARLETEVTARITVGNGYIRVWQTADSSGSPPPLIAQVYDLQAKLHAVISNLWPDGANADVPITDLLDRVVDIPRVAAVQYVFDADEIGVVRYVDWP